MYATNYHRPATVEEAVALFAKGTDAKGAGTTATGTTGTDKVTTPKGSAPQTKKAQNPVSQVAKSIAGAVKGATKAPKSKSDSK